EEEKKYTATGSGSPMAFGVLEDSYTDGMDRDTAVRVAVRSIRSARERDIFSGGKDIVVACIDKDGFRLADQEKIKEIAK
ncbi:proteasome subunit beta, partial [Candidatus Woesearchaeota archaeon]|nr:proteasome subunit beta [Candidatus Woesearchaeota archaeon]